MAETCKVCGYSEGHNWTCPAFATEFKGEFFSGKELHPIGTNDKLEAQADELDALRINIAQLLSEPSGGYTEDMMLTYESVWLEMREEVKARKMAMRIAKRHQDALKLVQAAFDDRTAEYHATRALFRAANAEKRSWHEVANAYYSCWDTDAIRAIKAERMRDAIQGDYNAAMNDVGQLYAMTCRLRDLVIAGSSDDSDEAREALATMALADDLIGVPPKGDDNAPDDYTERAQPTPSAPANADLAAQRRMVSACTAQSGATTEQPDHD